MSVWNSFSNRFSTDLTPDSYYVSSLSCLMSILISSWFYYLCRWNKRFVELCDPLLSQGPPQPWRPPGMGWNDGQENSKQIKNLKWRSDRKFSQIRNPWFDVKRCEKMPGPKNNNNSNMQMSCTKGLIYVMCLCRCPFFYERENENPWILLFTEGLTV